MRPNPNLIGRNFAANISFIVALLPATGGLADVFPGTSGSRSIGLKDAIYLVIRDDDAPALSQARINTIRDAEQGMREFYAIGSGGQFDMEFTHILDVPLQLNEDGTRPGNWRTLAKNYVRSNYSIEPDDFDSNVFDVNATTSDPDQGWAGVYYGGSNEFSIQANISSNWGKIVLDHELGHRVGADHAKALRAVDNGDFTPYVWNDLAGEYEVYNSASHGNVATPYGMRSDTYGNPFDTMGNISDGAFRMREKRDDLGWLTAAQVPDLETLGDGVQRIYAHNELDFTIRSDGVYGVVDTYDSNAFYGLTFQRQAERFLTGSSSFQDYTQRIDLEYRVNNNGDGRDGVQFYLDGMLLDLDLEGGTNRNNTERELEIGQSIEDIDFGLSIWDAGEDGNGDFLSYNPPPPTDSFLLRPEWFRFEVLSKGVDAIGSFIELAITTTTGLNGIAGDVNQDGFLDHFDVLSFRSGWLQSTTVLNTVDRYKLGDLDSSGRTELMDWILLRDAFLAAGLTAPALFATVPEPSSLLLLLVGVVGGYRHRCPQ